MHRPRVRARAFLAGLCSSWLALCGGVLAQAPEPPLPPPAQAGHPAGAQCLECHRKTSPALVGQWEGSAHAKAGVNCMDCHQAVQEDADAFAHEGQTVATLVSPLDCARCHEREVQQQQGSTHAKAALVLHERGRFLIDSLGGAAALEAGCAPCHGSQVKVGDKGKLAPETWPNTGIGRINPDGSEGVCSTCHTRHAFSKSEAREPQSCARCHNGADSPDQEIYAVSVHGLNFAAHRNKLQLDKPDWIVGQDYSEAPTCATCHMGAAPSLETTHDVGIRNAWKLNTPVSEQYYLVGFESGDKLNVPLSDKPPQSGDEFVKPDGNKGLVKAVAPPERRRAAMLQVCQACHGQAAAENFMRQFDNVVELYNEKFGKPAQALMRELYAQGKLTPAPFDEPLEYTYWELWHDAGARARRGAAMSSPEHVWWEGLYAVARLFYGSLLPQIRELAGAESEALIARHVRDQDGHAWLRRPQQADAVLGVDFTPPAKAPSAPPPEAPAGKTEVPAP